MLKTILIFFSLSCFIIVNAQSRLLSHSPQSITVEFSLPAVEKEIISLNGKTYHRIEYDGSLNRISMGAPILPYSIVRVAIPPTATISTDFDIIAQQTLKNIDIIPAVIVNGLKEENSLPRDEVIYQSTALYPGEIVEFSEPNVQQRMRVVDVRIYPIQYVPTQHQIQLLEKIMIRIHLTNVQPGVSVNELNTSERTVLSARVINFAKANDWVIPFNKNVSKFKTVNYDFSIGAWYKIPVSEEGLYRIKGSFLESQGIPLSSLQTDMIQVFNYGGRPLSTNVNRERPSDLNEIAIEVVDVNNNGILNNEDAIYFYGKAHRGWYYNSVNQRWDFYLNPYTKENYYLFTFNQNAGKRVAIESSPQFTNTTAVERFNDQFRFEDEKNNILESGLDWYWTKFNGTSDQETYIFELPENIIAETGLLEGRLKGGSGVHYWDTSNYTYTFSVQANNNSLLNNLSFTNKVARTFSINTSNFNSGSNTLTITYSGNKESCVAYLDYFAIRLERPLVAENNFLKIYQIMDSDPREFSVSNMPAENNRIWEITDPANIEEIIPLQNGSTVRFQKEGTVVTGNEFLVFNNSIARDIETIQTLPNSANLRDPQRKGKLLLIVADAFYDAAAPWEDFKETAVPERLETERIRVSDIFKEFSSCIEDPTAIRDFIKYAYENWSVASTDHRPSYVQLLGDGSYDYRNIELSGYQNQVSTFQITANDDIQSRVTDNFFTAINNTSNGMQNLDPQLAIARYPANNVTELNNYLAKLINYKNSFLADEYANGWQTVLTFVADDECASGSSCNEWFHTSQTEKIINEVPKKFDYKKIYLTDYETQAGGLGRLKPQASADLLEQINRGTLMINYFGHGDPNTWAHEQVLTKARDLPLIQNGAKLPVWVAATCTWGKYDDPNTPSMAEEMVWAANGGGIASIAASRPSFAFENEQFAKLLYRNLFNNSSDLGRSIRLGDAMQMSVGGGDNDQKYHLFGDVALRLADPEHFIKIDNISTDTLKALSTVSVSASVYDSEDNPLTEFNGKAVLRVFDAVDSTSSLGVSYVYAGGTIFKGIVTVVNGKIDNATFIVPKSIKYKDSPTGRISIYAWSENIRDAVGYNDQLLFVGSKADINDTEGPLIRFFFPDQPNFFDGDYVGQQPILEVELSDESGINLTGEVGHRIELIIDDRIKKDVTEFFVYNENEYKIGTLNYTLPALASGSHQLKITAWDNFNNYSEETLFFTTTVAEELALKQVVNYPNPFSDETYFTFQYQSPLRTGEVSVKIYTITGRLIQKISGIAQPGFNKIYWDGRDRDGDVLSNGVYLYKIIVDDGERQIEKTEKLAIVN